MAMRERRRDFHIGKRKLGPVKFPACEVIRPAGHEISAIRRAIDGHFTLRPATDRTDVFSARRAEPLDFPFLANRAGQKSLHIMFFSEAANITERLLRVTGHLAERTFYFSKRCFPKSFATPSQ